MAAGKFSRWGQVNGRWQVIRVRWARVMAAGKSLGKGRRNTGNSRWNWQYDFRLARDALGQGNGG